LENWKLFKLYWTEHNPSCTISYTPGEQDDIIEWVYNNQDIISGLSFLPKDDAVYEQMPYQSITEDEYIELIKNFPKEIDWNTLHSLERGMGDLTNASQQAACEGDKCLLTTL
jgi:ribonucleoside-diphosphate reductase alpha chain